MPERPDALRVHVGPLQQHVQGAEAVVDHHAPQDLASPEHQLEHVQLGRVAALAEDPVVDRERDEAEIGQLLRVRLRLQVAAALDELLLADRVAAAVRVVEEHGWKPARRATRAGDVGRHRLDAVEIEHPGLEDVAVVLGLRRLAPGHRARPVRQVSEQCVQLRPSAGRCCRTPSRACLRQGHGPCHRSERTQRQHIASPHLPGVHSRFHVSCSTLRVLPSTFYLLRSPFYVLPSTFSLLRSTSASYLTFRPSSQFVVQYRRFERPRGRRAWRGSRSTL